jgi:hypothetical protein
VCTYAHARGACKHAGIKLMQTDGHNQTVHAIARYCYCSRDSG